MLSPRHGLRAERDAGVFQYLDETAQVRALDVGEQVHRHADLGDRGLTAVFPVPHRDGVAQATDANLPDRQLPVIGAALNVVEHHVDSPR